jgi:hypothetical protein
MDQGKYDWEGIGGSRLSAVQAAPAGSLPID